METILRDWCVYTDLRTLALLTGTLTPTKHNQQWVPGVARLSRLQSFSDNWDQQFADARFLKWFQHQEQESSELRS